jgi:hypothetical protein
VQLGTAVLILVAGAGCSHNVPELVCGGEATFATELRVVDTGCTRGTSVEFLTECLESAGPDDCVAKIATALCDTDGDGLADDLEAALARAYAPAFAFNGGAFGGRAETHWPASASFFVAHARLTHGRGRHLIDPAPTLATLDSITSDGHRADDACEGRDFWLCLNDSSDATRVTSAANMRAVPGGIDVLSVAHPANGALDGSTHLFVSFSLLFPFNAHSTVDDHEGDWEGIAVFIDRKTGAVDAGWFERHKTADEERFVATAKYPVREAAREQPYGTIGSAFGAAHGLRFWDHAGAQHHVIAYVATGGHAMYDYPADTRIFKYGPRDTHSGDGPKIVPWQSRIVASFGATDGDSLAVTFVDPGEPRKITLPWARFRGQWGCSDGAIGKSWPGPFGNGRHPRPMFERVWGSPPAAPSSP